MQAMPAEDKSTSIRNSAGWQGWAIRSFGLVWALFHLYTAGFGALPNLQQRAVHLGGALILTFLLYSPGRRHEAGRLIWIDTLLSLAAAVAAGYVFVNYNTIMESLFLTNPPVERALGLLLLLLVLEAIRRTLGWFFVGFVLLFIAYAFLGPYIPGTFGHKGVLLDRFLFTFYLSTEGIWGTLTSISANVVAVFILFGAVLNASGAGETIMKLACRLGGRFRGGAGLLAVLSSAFMGLINGSAVANVATTGVFTIPLMKRLDFNPNLAGAIEAVASTGGQFMPPVMGPGAFLLAELLGISYAAVMKAALVPSLLYFFGVALGVYLFALRYGFEPIPRELIPSRHETYRPFPLLSLLLPVVVLVWLVLRQYTAQYAAFWAIVVTSALMGLRAIVQGSGGPARVLESLRGLGQEIERSVTGLVYVVMIIAAGQIVVSLINLTGLGVKLSQIIINLGQQSTLLALMLAMVVTVILGMGMPTPAAYAVAAAVLGPPLLQVGLEPLPAHLFLYYFACLAAITPPVAAAVYVAVAISGGSFGRTALYANALGLSLLVIPFVFVQNSALLLEGDTRGVVLSVMTSVVGVALLSVAAVGFLFRPIWLVFRVILGAAGVMLIVPGWISDLVGLAAAGVVLLIHLAQSRLQWEVPSRGAWKRGGQCILLVSESRNQAADEPRDR